MHQFNYGLQKMGNSKFSPLTPSGMLSEEGCQEASTYFLSNIFNAIFHRQR